MINGTALKALEDAIHARAAYLDGKELRFLAPCHADQNPSARWNSEKHTWYCDVCKKGGGVTDLAERLGLSLANGNAARSPEKHVATYEYTETDGVLIRQVLRYEYVANGKRKKTFKQRRPDDAGGWIWDMKGIPRVPYRKPDLAGHVLVFDPEGEKAVERLWKEGLPATCNDGGAGKWSDELTQQLKALGIRTVIVLPDNDDPGRQHALSVARSCFKAGLAVKIVSLPNLPPKGDVSDYFDAGGTVEQLHALVETRPFWTPEAAAPDRPTDETREPLQDDRPELDCDDGDLDALTTQAWQIMDAQNRHDLLYRRGTIAVRLETEDNGRARLVELTDARLRYEVARLARCTKSKRSPFVGHVLGREDCKPPIEMIRNMLAAPSSDIPLPLVRGIVEVPVVSQGGVLIQTPGYDRDSQLLYHPYDPTAPITVPMRPTSDDLTWARGLLDELLIDFPFASNADRTNHIGTMLLLFVRHFIQDSTPLALYEAPGPGTGKGLLVETSLYPAVGKNVGIIADARDDDEMRKRITARLLEGAAVTLFDNITRPVDSGVIAAAITAHQWEDRRLGKTETLSLPVTTIWVMTANNPTLSLELARRAVRIRLDSKVDQPWLRDGFRHPNLKEWVHQERAPLIRALLTLVQGWLAADAPAPSTPLLGSFESWSRVVGGILECAGYTDFLGNALAFYEAADSDGATWRTFTELWWAAHHDQPVSVKDLFPIAEGLDGLYLGKAANERGQRSALGRHLKRRRDQVIGLYRIEEAGSSNNAALWRLRLLASPVAVHAPPPPFTEEEVVSDDH